MTMDLIFGILTGLLVAATPLIFAALGELVVERSGVLNLGVEGMMVVGAIAGFVAKLASGSYFVGFAAAMVSGVAMAMLFGFATQILRSNQVASGLALTLFGLGLSALAGNGYSGVTAGNFPRFAYGADVLMIIAFAMVGLTNYFIEHTRAGLVLRAVGENHDAAHAIGFAVVRVRLAALAFGGAMAGLGGAYLSLVQTPFWVERRVDCIGARCFCGLASLPFAGWSPLIWWHFHSTTSLTGVRP
jgi:general nucleoside transport system permease protein